MSDPTAFDPKECPMPLDFFLNHYRISRTTAWRWRKRGLPTLRVGAKLFVREGDFLRFLENGGNLPRQDQPKQ